MRAFRLTVAALMVGVGILVVSTASASAGGGDTRATAKLICDRTGTVSNTFPGNWSPYMFRYGKVRVPSGATLSVSTSGSTDYTGYAGYQWMSQVTAWDLGS